MKKTLIYKSAKYEIWKIENSELHFVQYILTLSHRFDCWLLRESVYNDGDIKRYWKNSGYYFDFEKMTWTRE